MYRSPTGPWFLQSVRWTFGTDNLLLFFILFLLVSLLHCYIYIYQCVYHSWFWSGFLSCVILLHLFLGTTAAGWELCKREEDHVRAAQWGCSAGRNSRLLVCFVRKSLPRSRVTTILCFFDFNSDSVWDFCCITPDRMLIESQNRNLLGWRCLALNQPTMWPPGNTFEGWPLAAASGEFQINWICIDIDMEIHGFRKLRNIL